VTNDRGEFLCVTSDPEYEFDECEPYTQDRVEKLFAAAKELEALLDAYCQQRSKIDPDWQLPGFDFGDCGELYDDCVEWEYEPNAYSYDDRRYTGTIPDCDLWDPNWADSLKAEITRREAQKLREEAERKLQKLEAKHARERAEYARLKEKFEKEESCH